MASLWDAYGGGGRRNTLTPADVNLTNDDDISRALGRWRGRGRSIPFGMDEARFRDYVRRVRERPGQQGAILSEMGLTAPTSRTVQPPLGAPNMLGMGNQPPGEQPPNPWQSEVTPGAQPPPALDTGDWANMFPGAGGLVPPTASPPPRFNPFALPPGEGAPNVLRREGSGMLPPGMQDLFSGTGGVLRRMTTPTPPPGTLPPQPPPPPPAAPPVDWSGLDWRGALRPGVDPPELRPDDERADVGTGDILESMRPEDRVQPGRELTPEHEEEVVRGATLEAASRPPPPARPEGPGYLDRLMNNRAFLMGLSILGTSPGGNWGPNAVNSALAAQRARREETEYERLQNRRTVMDRVWGEAFPNGQPNPQHPLLQNVPPEMVSTIFAMGPEAGLTELQKLQFFRAQRQEALRIQQQQMDLITGGNQPPGNQPPPGNLQPGNLQPPGIQEQPPPPGLLGQADRQPPPGSPYQEQPPPPGLLGSTGNLDVQRQPPREPMVNAFGRQVPLSQAVQMAQRMDLAGLRNDALEKEIAEVRRNAQTPEAVRTRALTVDTAYRTITSALDDYVKLVETNGANWRPGEYNDAVRQARTNLQLQMKELFNLGVLNGPDLALMENMIVDPGITSGFNIIPGQAGSRVRASADRLREMLRGIRNSAVRPLGMEEAGGEFRIERVR